MMKPQFPPNTQVWVLYRDGRMTSSTSLDDPDLWTHTGDETDILLFQIDKPNRNIDYWERLTAHVEQFDLIVPRLDCDFGAELVQGWSDTRKQLYQIIQMELFRRWLDAFQEMEKTK